MLDGGAMFGIVPKTLWSKTNPSDENNRIEMRLRCLLLVEVPREKNSKVILIDTGIGTKWADKQMKIYGIDHSHWSLDRELARLKIATSQVTDIIATHMHFDHMGGLTRYDKNGETVPSFENAKIWLQKRNWEQAFHPNEKDQASYLKDGYDLYRNDSHLHLLETSYGTREEILPGITVRVSDGHTVGMQLVEIEDDTHSLLYCADAIPTATHVRTPYVMGYDCFPLKMIEEKKAILRNASEKGTMLFLEHCPRAEAVSILHDGKDFAVKNAFTFS